MKSGGELKDGRGARMKAGRQKMTIEANAMIRHDGIDDHEHDVELGAGISKKTSVADAITRDEDWRQHRVMKGRDHDDDFEMGRSEKMTAASTMSRHQHMGEKHGINDNSHDAEIGMGRSEKMAMQGRHKKTIVGGGAGPGRPEKASVSGSMLKKLPPANCQDVSEIGIPSFNLSFHHLSYVISLYLSLEGKGG